MVKSCLVIIIFCMAIVFGYAQDNTQNLTEQFGDSRSFVGLVVCADDYIGYIKWFEIIDPINTLIKSDSSGLILIAGSTGYDERQPLDCAIGDTLLIQAYFRNSPYEIHFPGITIIEDKPLYSLPFGTYGYFEYKKGICYLAYPNEEIGRYSDIKKRIYERINKTK